MKKKYKFLIFLLLTFFLFSNIYLLYEVRELEKPENRNLTKKVYQKVEKALVLIECFSDDITKRGMGSGFIIAPNNSVLTASHVIEGANKIWIYENGKDAPWEAELKGRDDLLDVALLVPKVNFKNTAFLVLGNSDKLEKGDLVWAVGAPLTIKNTISEGRVINKDTTVKDGYDESRPMKAILSDAIFNKGSSGGPLVNFKGEVVGINTQVIGGEGTLYNIYFSIPINSVKKVLWRLNLVQEIEHFKMGVRLTNTWDLSDTDYERLKIERPKQSGPMIIKIEADSIAEKAELALGDVIKFIGKIGVKNSLDFMSILQLEYEIGDELQITIIRKDERMIKILK